MEMRINTTTEKTNIEKLVDSIMEKNPDLVPVYLKVLEVILPAISKERRSNE